ncbi:hypothetical protein MTO98_15290 [Mucilaginibacter sp. SMC90]|uniref:hypothetical protein n=1 Tax=unclassified Mucilaginibacter TaxID=2617802 RepID=UPI001FB43E95|nr:hypothetical protein [Mucilaginibacter sp. SMC90]UOE52439.1 hypothetical protein MTO98_15290 [Mucilaginibacter sp. SMC90]
MKKILLGLIVLAVTGFKANAQIQQGNVLVGGNFANINLGLNDPKIFSLDITPKAAWFVRDNVALGGYVNLGIETAKGSNTTVSYGVGALGRYYTGSDVEILRHGRIFGEATVGLGGVNVSNGGGNTNGLNFSFGPGFAYFITPSIGLETLLKYNGLGGFGSQGYQSNLNLSFGFQIYLPGQRTANKVKSDAR